MSEILIRPATPADAQAYGDLLVAIDQESLYFLLGQEEAERSVEQRAYDIADLVRRGALFLAVDGAQVVGFGRAEAKLYNPLYEAIIALGVRRAYQRQGIGIRLLQALEAWARRMGVHRLLLRVAAANEPALALYAKMGFEEAGLMAQMVCVDRLPVDLYVMVKWLQGEFCWGVPVCD